MTLSPTVTPIYPLNLALERDSLGSALDEAVLGVLHSGQFVLGPEVQKLETDFAQFCGAKYGIGVASGTEAIVLALRAVGVKPGDEVVTSPFTFFASAAAVAWTGATPRLADVDPATALLDLQKASAAVGPKTTCILPVHLYGQMVDVHAYRALCDSKGLALVEDAAQAHGATFKGAGPGTIGDAAAFSFYPTKNLGGAGEGGLVTTSNEALNTSLRLLRDHGSPAKYVHTVLGTNARMHAFQGAVLNVKLPHLAAWNERRRAIAKRYDEGFAGLERAVPLLCHSDAVHSYHQYTLRVLGGGRDATVTALQERGIHAAIHYPKPVHLQEAAADWGYGPGDFPIAEALCEEVLCLPVHPFLTEEDVDRVIAALTEILN
ncbi:MAG: dTDP-4-amino-4,6-dideoxygalactose transaminase [Planctomycetota bacterium]|jgi:dTDP-4-amino-4,6-dideoxygalactose transaminase